MFKEYHDWVFLRQINEISEEKQNNFAAESTKNVENWFNYKQGMNEILILIRPSLWTAVLKLTRLAVL